MRKRPMKPKTEPSHYNIHIYFFGYGLTAGGGATAFVAMALGAPAIASAAYLILDLSSPYSGLFRVSSTPLEQVLAVMGKE